MKIRGLLIGVLFATVLFLGNRNAHGEGGGYTPIAAPEVTIKAVPDVVMVGQRSQITWSVEGIATSVYVSGPGVSSSSHRGSAWVEFPGIGQASYQSTYTITATGPSGTRTAKVVVTANEPTPVITLKASSKTIVLGQSLNLILEANQPVSTCIASSTDGSWTGFVPCQGVIKVTPKVAGTVTYSIYGRAFNGSDTVNASVTISVSSSK